MSQLVDVLYPVPDLRRTALSSLRWWESRRLLFNQVVGATGLVTLACVSFFFALPPGTLGELDLLAMVAVAAAYGIAANACYTLGWLVELAARTVWGRRAPDIGPLLFRQGLIFSVGLTLFPVFLAALIWMVHVVLSIAS